MEIIPEGKGKTSTKNETSASTSSDNHDYKKKKKYTTLTNRNYVLHQTIGDGYCGIVKLATSQLHGCDVAIKIVSKFTAPSEYLKKFFPREIEVIRNLKHPNVIKYYQSIETTHSIYIIMEYAVNGNLFNYIKKHIHVNEPQSQKWFKQLVNVIEYCHDREIAHRDIKCENLLLDENFNLKLSDFGFARRVIKENGEFKLANTFCGSYAYTAPEILKGRSYNPLVSDIWSMGVVLYVMVHGCLPFDDTNYFVLLKQIRSEVRFPEKPKTSSECRELILRILKPRDVRPNLTNIKTDVWFTTCESTSRESLEDAKETVISDALESTSQTPEFVINKTLSEEFSSDQMLNDSEVSPSSNDPLNIDNFKTTD